MPHHNLHKEIVRNVKEKKVMEPEPDVEDHMIKQPQSGRTIEMSNISLHKCQSVVGPSKKCRKGKISDLEIQNLKLPQVPQKIVDLVSILQHENFLKVVDQYFKPGVNNQSQKKSQGQKSNARVEKFPSKPIIPVQKNSKSTKT